MTKQNQKHIKGEDNRLITWACVHPDTKSNIESLAHEHNVSESWIVAFALETFLYGKAFTHLPNGTKTRKRR